MRTKVLIGSLGLALVLSACDDPVAPHNSNSSTFSASPMTSERVLMADAAAPRAAMMSPQSAPAPRMEVGRTYQFEINNIAIDEALAADRAECLKLGCAITNVTTAKASGHPQASLRAFVPGDKADAFDAFLKAQDNRETISFNETSANRDEQYTDIKSRLQRLEFMKERLYALADTKSKEVGDLLQVERELMRIESEIERYTRNQKGLEKVTDNVAYTLMYSERPPKAGDVDFTPLTTLLTDGANTFIHGIRATALWVARWLPAVVLSIVVVFLLSRRRKNQQ